MYQRTPVPRGTGSRAGTSVETDPRPVILLLLLLGTPACGSEPLGPDAESAPPSIEGVERPATVAPVPPAAFQDLLDRVVPSLPATDARARLLDALRVLGKTPGDAEGVWRARARAAAMEVAGADPALSIEIETVLLTLDALPRLATERSGSTTHPPDPAGDPR